MVKEVVTAILLFVEATVGVNLVGVGILLQRWDESMLRFDQQPTTSS